MSSTCSRASAASVSDLNEPECEPSRSVRLTRSVGESLPSIGPTFPDMTTSGPSPASVFPQTGSRLKPSVADFHAKTSQKPAEAMGLTGRDPGFGETMPVSLAKFDPDTSSWRTSQHSLFGGLTEFSGTWPVSGMMLSGTAFPLPPLVPAISESDCGSSPFFPTPRADGGCNAGGSNSRRTAKRNGTYVSGSINPNLYEWLMGFPTEWTAVPPSATPLSRKSRKSSGEQS
jgi:hypothetical protein